MEEERKSLIVWIKEHKKELIIAGVSVAAIILIVLGIRNRAAIKALWRTLRKALTKAAAAGAATATVGASAEPVQEMAEVITTSTHIIPFEVSSHIRNLPLGWHASPEKIEEALKHGIVLMDGQTWVESYMKGKVVA